MEHTWSAHTHGDGHGARTVRCSCAGSGPGLGLGFRATTRPSVVRHAEQAGYRAGKTLYGLPYDWRLSPSENKICPDLAQLVTHVTNTTAHRKVESLCSSFYRDSTDATGMTRAMPTPGIAA